MMLGTPGGVVDLRTGSLRPSRPDDMVTKLAAVAPALEPDCSLWMSFLNDITRGDAAYIRFLRQWAGYCLTGSTQEQALAFAFGEGGNGKGVFVNTLADMLGDYATTAPMETFTESRGDRHPTEIAMLRGARLVVASETEEGRAWAESRIKQLTGGDRIAARFMRGDFFEFVPTLKLTFMGNHRPVLRNVGAAERRRFNLLPFTFKPVAPDKSLAEKLRAEWPAILTWAIDGCLDWQRDGLVRPDVVTGATNDYFAAQDVFGSWIAEALEVEHGNDLKFETSAALFHCWRDYATAAGESVGTQRSLAEKLKGRGFEAKRTKAVRGFIGVRLKQGRPHDASW
jgi:putative DNA primase/helicase